MKWVRQVWSFFRITILNCNAAFKNGKLMQFYNITISKIQTSYDDDDDMISTYCPTLMSSEFTLSPTLYQL